MMNGAVKWKWIDLDFLGLLFSRRGQNDWIRSPSLFSTYTAKKQNIQRVRNRCATLEVFHAFSTRDETHIEKILVVFKTDAEHIFEP